MDLVELNDFLSPTLHRAGFKLDEIQDTIIYGERPAGAIYYRGSDCKLQICWSAREGGIEFMLATLDTPNELGIEDYPKAWKFMLMLSDTCDHLRNSWYRCG